MSGLERANDLCKACLESLNATEDLEEKIVMVNVMTQRLNEWTLKARLSLIQSRSKHG